MVGPVGTLVHPNVAANWFAKNKGFAVYGVLGAAA